MNATAATIANTAPATRISTNTPEYRYCDADASSDSPLVDPFTTRVRGALRSADTAKCARYCVSTAVSLNRNVHGFNASRCIQ